MTPLDTAHAAMEAAPEDSAARLRFYERLADCELFLLLQVESTGGTVVPEVFDVDGSSFVLVFDSEERLADFAGKTVPYAAMSGRAIVRILLGKGMGLGLNLDVAPSAILIPQTAIDWLAATLDNPPAEVEDKPRSLGVPSNLPASLVAALDTKLASAAGLARMAYVVAVTYEDDRNSHMVAFIDALPGTNGALAGAVGEALTFSGLEAEELDVAFFAASDPICASLAKVGLRFDLPVPEVGAGPISPGSDPSKPPILR